MEKDKDIMNIIKKALSESILSVPGVANIYEKDNNYGIKVNKSDLGWIIDINIVCFFNNNIWNIMNQTQKNLKYIVEKIIKHQDYIVLNIFVHDLIEE
ncbi:MULTISPECIES: hypothetical protein [Spiroplasma]|uniref:Asp23/Gls24 family envelope stress response protein n=2 Tax=Spiroplasma TaxID=2132 RepID=A0ABN6T0N6_9MOLU|nr:MULTISPECIES: hypothetical protein [Spiroplasma]WDA54075.1 MAG: hypothetical protein PPFGHCPK_00492 [Spiroplasma endosymbiont of Drosophila atripex]MBP1525723.1 hypothetical protein [Spiroplasma ixodetis]MBP1527176.1 hypothetical protein [Spiroplasma ixodetis]MBP1528373.1 hypothetical protein [Spiroplasma ixodetis]BDT04980.1 hypothetical protein SHM_26260 [Spiroplasma ixodetis]